MTELFLLFSHELTAVQERELSHRWGVTRVRPLPDDLQQRWSHVPPDVPEVAPHVQPVLDWLREEADPDDLVLVQGDFGATYLAVSFCFRHGLVPIYATTERIHRETVSEDGHIAVQKVFQHRLFRRYGR